MQQIQNGILTKLEKGPLYRKKHHQQKFPHLKGLEANIWVTINTMVIHCSQCPKFSSMDSNTYSQVQANSLQIWKYQRYFLVMEYAQRPILPPPFIILNHVAMLVKGIYRRLHCCKRNQSQDLFSDHRLSESWNEFHVICNSLLQEAFRRTG